MSDEWQTMVEVVATFRVIVGPYLPNLPNEEIRKAAREEVITKISGPLRGAKIEMVGEPRITKIETLLEKPALT